MSYNKLKALVANVEAIETAMQIHVQSGLILSLLHDNTITRTAGFETIDEQDFEHPKFDVIASNIPFGNFRVFDAELWKKGGAYEQATKTIHNYFFVKAMELLNEGGLLAFITSRGVADTPSNKFVREYLINHADLISAVRLPDIIENKFDIFYSNKWPDTELFSNFAR